MDENNKKERNELVTFLLRANIAVNAFLLLFPMFPISFLFYAKFNLLDLGGTLFIAVIVGNILILRWRIIGVFIICVAAILFLLFVISDSLATSFGAFGVIALLIYFAILNIEENGISVWKHLLNEAKLSKRKAKIWDASILGVVILLLAIIIFPITRIYDNTIVIFAPLRAVFWNGIDGMVLGNHILETEYGEIRIGHLASVNISKGVLHIKSRNFKNGQASHSLVLSGVELPEYIDVEYSRSQSKITSFDLNHQDMHIYGVPVRAKSISIRLPDDILPSVLSYSDVIFLQEHIMLADSTELNVTNANLSLYKDEQRWVLEKPHNASLFAKRAGETEFTEYRLIRFKENWGEFIKGVPLEENDPRALP